ncbi:MAG: LPS assembly protein LptD [Puniceicoccales bacterium]|nr:LPS assembly protein LptD [Puniceicoccales bacterium]
MAKKSPLILILAGACIALGAFEISSDDPIEYIDSSGELVARSNAKISLEDFTLRADEIKFQKPGSMAVADGNVQIDNGECYALSNRVSCDIPNGLVHAEVAKISHGDYFFRGENIDMYSDEQTGHNGEVFFSNPDSSFAPSICVSKFRISNGEILRAEDVKLRIGSVPVFYWPAMEVELDDRPVYAEQNFGIGSRNGVFLQNDIWFRVRRGIRVGLLLDFYSKRGFLFGPTISIDHNVGKHRISSELKIGGISDRGKENIRGMDVNGSPIAKKRGFIEFIHKQHYGDRTDIISHVQRLSDSEVERDFRKSLYDSNHRAESFVEVSYRGDNYVASAFSRFEPNNFYDSTERLPEFRLDYLPTKLFESSLVHNAHLSVARLRGTDKMSGDVNSYYRTDIYYGASLPVDWDDFVTVKPMFGVLGLTYHRDANDSTRSAGVVQGGFDVDFKFAGQCDYENETFEIDGLRHTITPTIQYRVIPSGNASDAVPKLDVEFFNTEIPSIDLDDMRNVDHLEKQNMIRAGVRNGLFTKSKGYVPKKLMRFDVFQDIFFQRNYDNFAQASQKTFQDMHILFEVYPVRWLDFKSYGKLDPSKFSLRQLKTATSIHDADFWKATFFTNFFRSPRTDRVETEQYGLSFTFNLSSQTALSIEERYDARIGKLSEQRFSFSTTLCNSWLVDVGITLRENARREDRFQFNWHLKLLNF